MNNIRQEITECKIPSYLENILANNYCPNFLNMNMVKENDEYIFNYQTGRYQKIDVANMNTYLKLNLLKSIILLNERNENWLIRAENYLIEPELIYCINNNVEDGNVRILFYPDYNKRNFQVKMLLFAEKIKNKKDKSEMEIIERFKEVVNNEDWNRVKNFLDKNILRLETSWN